ncbi:ribosome-releasing factor 2, mitochondrial-like [Amphibalanus amphitrite]|uniref:ribosome-releasing factor 2, mitochondrial-like n=1 Tax=Amphibalanus amphitrite TaxID=1232801 RepID=UPI001C925078|nr:ribosome-releasing factor 2, mitochondrial-like [Amphibalanus amphitrite]XP_043213992.1 ribosome-releasing factor 2, mitochondrial-like [Amphibalanus amphitrite]
MAGWATRQAALLCRYRPQLGRRRAHLAWRGQPAARGRATPKADDSLVRNVGIIAHIDAGKTTTTERLLYYSGAISAMGEVHDGAATMDFLEQERARGITVAAAAVSLPWRDRRLNLIDTPGHADFTLEVERSLRVLDGAVAVLDAAAGVQAQTLTVWRQSARYQLPVIVFVNKMDKRTADLDGCLRSMHERLGVPPLLTQLPLGEGAQFRGVVELGSMTRLEWPAGGDGKKFDSRPLREDADGALWERAAAARATLVEQAAELDDTLATEYLEAASAEEVSGDQVRAALRRLTLRRAALPTLCGSAYRNTAVQPLLDAVAELLPAPAERLPDAVKLYGDSLCALAFKTVHCRQRGALTYVRVYSGALEPGQRVYNVSRAQTERLGRVMTPSADQLTEEPRVTAGHIAVVSGLRETATGDTLAASQTAASAARRRAGSDGSAALLGVTIPEPVFFCSVEPPSLAKAKALETALERLQLEDPSLRVTQNEETGQTVLSGMGELHLAIVKDRLLREHGVEAELGAPQVSYRETPRAAGRLRHRLARRIADTNHEVELELHLEPESDAPAPPQLLLAPTEESAEQLRTLRPRLLAAAERGVRAALAHGPLLGCPVVGVQPRLSWLHVAPRTAEHVVTAAAARCTAEVLRAAGCRLLEPVMALHVTTAADALSAVLADLSTRRAQVRDVRDWHGEKLVLASAPLAELRDYNTALRTLSSGLASFAMELETYCPMAQYDEDGAIESVTGFRPQR